jgi:capsular polysaccharide biosynthesis protein
MPVLVCGIACGILAFVIATVLPNKYTAEAVVVVPSGGKDGLTPGEASNLATTYTNLIPEDREVLARAAPKLGLTPAEVRESLLVTHDFDTSLLRLSFSNPDPAVAVRGSRIIAESIAGPKPVSARIAPDTISIVARPQEATTSSMDPLQAIVLGLFLGLVGGSLLMLAWDRSDARVRDTKDLGLEAGCAASSLRQASDGSLVALLQRWIDIGGTTPLRVAMLAATDLAEPGCERAADRLLQVARGHRQVVRMGEQPGQSELDIVLDVGGAVGGQKAGERLARNANLVVVVVAEETPVDDLRHALEILERFDARPDWALLVDRPDPTMQRALASLPAPPPAQETWNPTRRGSAEPQSGPYIMREGRHRPST